MGGSHDTSENAYTNTNTALCYLCFALLCSIPSPCEADLFKNVFLIPTFCIDILPHSLTSFYFTHLFELSSSCRGEPRFRKWWVSELPRYLCSFLFWSFLLRLLSYVCAHNLNLQMEGCFGEEEEGEFWRRWKRSTPRTRTRSPPMPYRPKLRTSSLNLPPNPQKTRPSSLATISPPKTRPCLVKLRIPRNWHLVVTCPRLG